MYVNFLNKNFFEPSKEQKNLNSFRETHHWVIEPKRISLDIEQTIFFAMSLEAPIDSSITPTLTVVSEKVAII